MIVKENNKTYDIIRYRNGRIVVAVINDNIKDFAVYTKYTTDWKECAMWGDKISRDDAEKIFPELFELYRWRP